MKIVLAPDSFKGTLRAEEVCAIEKEALLKIFKDAEILSIPMADGGEGMVDAYLQILGGERVTVTVTGPAGMAVEADYGILPDGTAVIEMAQASGLPLMKERPDPLHATTYGVGELMAHAKNSGAEKILLGLGGSATNDCGMGMAQALGFRFFDKEGKEFSPAAKDMKEIGDLTIPALGLKVTAACDVDTPLLGPEGATYTFGPQKGADGESLVILEDGMRNLADVLERKTGIRPDVPGAGAAGGMGAAVLTMLGGRLASGCELLLDAAGFDEIIDDAAIVITGEGRIDGQSVHGKVPVTVGKRCQKMHVPCIAICGAIGQDAEEVKKCGIQEIYGKENDWRSMDEIRKSCREDLKKMIAHAFMDYK